jgi:hypothetical protein
VVKNTGSEKIGILSDYVERDYVNSHCISTGMGPVENSCGKSCGECGKV